MEEVSDVAGACSAEMQKFGIHSARWVFEKKKQRTRFWIISKKYSEYPYIVYP